MYALLDTEKYCDDGFQSIFKVMTFIYAFFIVKAITQVVFISVNSDVNVQKLSLSSMNYIAHL